MVLYALGLKVSNFAVDKQIARNLAIAGGGADSSHQKDGFAFLCRVRT